MLSWFVAGGLTYYVIVLHDRNVGLDQENAILRNIQVQYEQQVKVNAAQRQEFEARIQQLQSNLQGAQSQMSNLSEALQQAREMIDPSL